MKKKRKKKKQVQLGWSKQVSEKTKTCMQHEETGGRKDSAVAAGPGQLSKPKDNERPHENQKSRGKKKKRKYRMNKDLACKRD
jgi:Fe-S-cluster-containing dehydrogenase component